jgi:hypothetical protein
MLTSLFSFVALAWASASKLVLCILQPLKSHRLDFLDVSSIQTELSQRP